MNETLARIVKRELEKLEAFADSDLLMSGEQLESLEALARIVLKTQNGEDQGPSMSVDEALALVKKP